MSIKKHFTNFNNWRKTQPDVAAVKLPVFEAWMKEPFGSEIGYRLAEELGIKYYDKDLVVQAAKESGMCEQIMAQEEETPAETEQELDLLAESQPVVKEEIQSKSWIGLVLIAGVLTFLLAGALIFRSVSRKGRY